MARQYYALNGHEIVDDICAKVKEKLLNSGEFSISRCFPVVTWSFEMTMEVYPAVYPKTIKGEGRQTTKDPKGNEIEESMGEPKHVEIETGRVNVGKDVAPDQVRVESGLRMPKAVTKRGMGTVDEMVESLDSKN